jgi:ATP-dependent RNA helicase HelY
VSTARKIADDLEETPSLTDSESSMWSDVQAELGGEQYSLLSPLAAALPHNGDMIPLERRLAEALFRRESGASVIVATPTLAQGMNLPAQLAILAGDKRHDDDVGRRALEPHEILNAAGRAGRAGHLANGVVLLIPEPVLSFAENNAPEPDAFDKLRAVLPSDDKCVVVEDPIKAVLDRIQSGNTADLQVQYFLSRVQAADDPAEAAENVLAAVRRSFSRFLAVKSNDQAVFDAKIEALSAVIAQEGPTNPSVFATGASHGIAYTPLLAIHDRLAADPTQIPQSIVAWSDWLIDFFAADRASYAALMESDVSTALYVMRGSKQGGPLTNQEFAKLRAAMRLWLSGRPYSEIEVALGATAAEIKNCPRTRDLILKLANRRLYLIFSSVAEIAKQIYSAADIAVPQMSVLETLAVAIRKGFDTPDKVAYDHIQRTIRSRVVAHASFANAFPTPLMLQGQSYQIVMDQVSMRLLGARTR